MIEEIDVVAISDAKKLIADAIGDLPLWVGVTALIDLLAEVSSESGIRRDLVIESFSKLYLERSGN